MATYLRPVTVAINGKTKMFLLPLLLNRYVLGLIGALALMAGGYWAWEHYVAAPYRAEGRAEMVPTIERQTAQLQADVEAFKQIESSMLEIKANSEKLKKQVAAAQAANAGRKAIETTRIEYIDRIVPTGNTECERTTDAISKGLRK